jgi:hypothetical protein
VTRLEILGRAALAFILLGGIAMIAGMALVALRSR